MKFMHHFAAGLALLFASCVTAPFQIPNSHPASPMATESPRPIARPMLTADEDSRRTQTLLEERARQAKAADDEVNGGPIPDQPTAAPSSKPPMDHSGMSMPMDH